MRTLTLMGLILLLSVTVIGSAAAQQSTFVKSNEKARFIHGENLVTDIMPEPAASVAAQPQTRLRKAAGLSAVMATRDGDLYESRMDPADVALFE